jgi:hypothetical protein
MQVKDDLVRNAVTMLRGKREMDKRRIYVCSIEMDFKWN